MLVIAFSFVYIPFLGGGMIAFYLKLTGVAVVPLMVVYVMGVLTRVARASATMGLLIGIACGLSRFVDPVLLEMGLPALPVWWTNTWFGYLWSILATGLGMIVASLIWGWVRAEEIPGLTVWSAPAKRYPTTSTTELTGRTDSWLDTSLEDVPAAVESPFTSSSDFSGWLRNPLLWSGLLLGIMGYLNLVLFW